jgi:hypothetical protein
LQDRGDASRPYAGRRRACRGPGGSRVRRGTTRHCACAPIGAERTRRGRHRSPPSSVGAGSGGDTRGEGAGHRVCGRRAATCVRPRSRGGVVRVDGPGSAARAGRHAHPRGRDRARSRGRRQCGALRGETEGHSRSRRRARDRVARPTKPAQSSAARDGHAAPGARAR